jgi:hypothetical protein
VGGGEGGGLNVGCIRGIYKLTSCVHFVTAVDPDVLGRVDVMASNTRPGRTCRDLRVVVGRLQSHESPRPKLSEI